MGGFQIQIDFTAANRFGAVKQTFAAQIVVATHDLADAVRQVFSEDAHAEFAARGDAQCDGNDEVAFAQAENKAFQTFLTAPGNNQEALNRYPKGQQADNNSQCKREVLG